VVPRELPQMLMPFPSRCHPERDETEIAGLEWVRSYVSDDARYQRIVEAKSGHFVARLAPRAPRHMLDSYTRFLMWSFWFDDQVVDDADANSPLLVPATASNIDMLSGGAGTGAAGAGLEKAFSDVLGELRSVLSVVQFTCFAVETREWMLSFAMQNRLRSTEEPPQLSTYLTTRHYTADILPWLVLAGVAEGADLSWDEYHSPELTALRTHATNITAWQNDIFSFFAESRHPGRYWNIPAVFRAHGCTTEQAVQKAADLANAEVEKFLTVKARAEHQLSPGAQAFMVGCENMIRAGYDWSHELADRYPGWLFTSPPEPATR
jgi:hypothetical protein